MRTKFYLLMVLLAGLCISCSRPYVDTVLVEGGLVQGVLSEVNADVMVFKGIPFAAPPVGELRWRKPQPVVPWEGVLVADHYKKICPQVLTRPLESYPEKYRILYTEHDEDCLYLNVWAPASTVGDPDAKLPVMFWIHGGAYRTGSGITMSTDGDAWAQHGVILVTINYRLNVLGFLNHPALTAESGKSGNYGLYDQVAALKWTYENIGQFGGDPDNITIAGQSAGARSVKYLSTSPLAKPYISKVIVESGGGLQPRPETWPEARPQSVLDAAGAAYFSSGGFETLAQMRAASYEDIIQGCEGQFAASAHPDGELLITEFDQAVYEGTVADIPFLIGYNDAESQMFEPVHNFCRQRAATGSQPVYEYMFCRTPGKSGDCPHSGELVYVFNTLDRRDDGSYPQADYDLSEKVVTYWTNFCKFANPCGAVASDDWRPYSVESPFTKVLDIEK